MLQGINKKSNLMDGKAGSCHNEKNIDFFLIRRIEYGCQKRLPSIAFLSFGRVDGCIADIGIPPSLAAK